MILYSIVHSSNHVSLGYSSSRPRGPHHAQGKGASLQTVMRRTQDVSQAAPENLRIQPSSWYRT